MTCHRSALKTDVYNAVAFILNNYVSPTDIALAAEQASPDANTDAVYFDADYGTTCGISWHPAGTGIGLNSCASLSGSKCQRTDVRIDNSFTDGVSNDWDRAIACHETGHTLGLLHRANAGTEIGCMPSTVPLVVSYSSHDVPHINSNY